METLSSPLDKLSDELLTCIFQQLSTPEAVEAGCSIKKWSDLALWVGTHILSFNISAAYEKARPTEPRSVTRARFAQRVAMAFSKRDALTEDALVEFRLVFHFADRGERNDEVRSWVRDAVSRGAKKIDLTFTNHSRSRPMTEDEDYFVLIEMVTTDEPIDFSFHFSDIQISEVKEFRLDNAHFELVDALDLSALSKLWLGDVHSQSDADVTHLISLCRNLQKFFFQRASLEVKTGRVEIHSTTLQILSWRSISYNDKPVILSIEAPALKSITIFGFNGESYSFNLPSLMEADIECYIETSRSETACDALQYAAQKLYGVRRLRFQNAATYQPLAEFQVFESYAYMNLQVFELLTSYHEKEIVELCLFLRASPLLEKLVLVNKYDMPYYSDLRGSPWFGSRCSAFEIPSLKKVVLKNYQETPNEKYTVELLIKSRVMLDSILAKDEGCIEILWNIANHDGANEENKGGYDEEADQIKGALALFP